MTKLIHIFKVGKHTPTHGATINFNSVDLQRMAKAYDSQFHEASICIGHPKDNHPAYGWVKSLVCNDEGLFAEVNQLDPNFAEAVRSGRYKKVSAAFYAPDSQLNPSPGVYYLRHIGFLGAEPPAIKGMQSPEFNEKTSGIIFFNELSEASMSKETEDKKDAGFIAKLASFLKKELGDKEAEALLPTKEIAPLDSALQKLGEGKAELNSKGGNDATPLLAEAAKKLIALEKENVKLQKQLADEKAKSIQTTKSTEFSELIKRKIPVTHRGAFEAQLSSVNFSERQQLTDYLNSLPDLVEFGELAKKQTAPTQATVNPLVADAERRAASYKR